MTSLFMTRNNDSESGSGLVPRVVSCFGPCSLVSLGSRPIHFVVSYKRNKIRHAYSIAHNCKCYHNRMYTSLSETIPTLVFVFSTARPFQGWATAVWRCCLEWFSSTTQGQQSSTRVLCRGFKQSVRSAAWLGTFQQQRRAFRTATVR